MASVQGIDPAAGPKKSFQDNKNGGRQQKKKKSRRNGEEVHLSNGPTRKDKIAKTVMKSNPIFEPFVVCILSAINHSIYDYLSIR